MTDFVIRAGVLETTNSTGTGTLDLDGAATGWNRFRTRDLADNDYIVYVRRSANGAKEQLVRGQLKFGTGAGGRDQLTVVNVLASSDGGATPTAIDWIAGDNPCAVYMASAEDLLDSAIRSHFGDTLPSWVKQALWVAKGSGVTARKLRWRDGTGSDVEIATINETTKQVTFTQTSTDAGATTEFSTKYWNSASPAANDEATLERFTIRNATPADKIAFELVARLLDVTAGSEDAELRWKTAVAGTLAERLRLGAGLYTPGATGGDKGTDTINATTLYVGGVAIDASSVVHAAVNFNGTGTPAVRGTPRNVASITDNGTGDYTINFTSALPTANYTVVGTASDDGTNLCSVGTRSATAPTTTALRVLTGQVSTLTDVAYIGVACIGG